MTLNRGFKIRSSPQEKQRQKNSMKIVKHLILLGVMSMISACDFSENYPPIGRWEVVDRSEVYANNDHPLVVAFVVEKGETCAISEQVLIRKDMGYSRIACRKGRGWIFSTLHFKKLSD